MTPKPPYHRDTREAIAMGTGIIIGANWEEKSHELWSQAQRLRHWQLRGLRQALASQVAQVLLNEQ